MENPDPELIFDIVRLLDSGGHADVYLLHLRATGGVYAGKFLREAWDPQARVLFRKEAERQHRVAGEHVVPIITWNLDAEMPFVVMQYMPGGSLAKEIERRGGLSVVEALKMTHRIAVALADLHGRGVVHRDLKPGNILVDIDGRLRLSDLGIAATMSFSEFVRAPGFVGTDGYAAPEQYRGIAVPQSDVFALGQILRELALSKSGGAAVNLGQRALALADRLSNPEWRRRPTASEAASLLSELLRTQPSASGLVTSTAPTQRAPTQRSASGDGLGKLIVGGLALASLAALFSGGTSSWDPAVERYRRSDGRFAKG